MYNLILSLICVISLQQLFAQERLVTRYTVNEGLPTQTIYDCTQDTLGNMWFAAEGGLIKYDGFEWEYVDTFYSNNFRRTFGKIKKDESGNLWAFPQPFQNTVYLYDYSNWKPLRLGNLNKIDEHLVAVDFNINSKDTIIALTTGDFRVSIYLNEKIHQIDFFKNSQYRTFDIDISNTALYVSTIEGVYEYDLESISKNFLSANQMLSGVPVLSLEIPDNSPNKFHALTNSSLLSLEKNKSSEKIDNLNIIYSATSLNYIFLTSVDPHQHFFGSKYEAYIYNDITERLTIINEKSGFTTNGATSCCIDSEKNIWLTTLRGINKIRFTPFSTYNSNDGLLENEVASIEKFPGGPIVLGHNNGFTLWENSNFKKIRLFEDKYSSKFSRVLNLSYDRESDKVWFISQFGGIGYITRSGKINWRLNEKNTGRSFLSIFNDTKGKIYFSDNNGIFLFDGLQEKSLALDRHINARKITRFDSSHLLLATRTGVKLLNTNSLELTSFSTDEELSNEIYAFYQLDSTNWLVGTYGGLLVFDGNTLSPFSKLKLDKPVFFIGQENEVMWFGLMGGALRWNPGTGEQKLFTQSEGLAGIETNRDAFLYSDNKVYIGTDKGLSVFSPEVYNEKVYRIKPKLYFGEIVDDNNFHYQLSDNISLPFNKNNLKLSYQCASFIDEKKNTFLIHVNNLDEKSTETFETQTNNYIVRNLQPGKYILGINAVNANGISSDTLYSSEIIIKAPFYLQGWFLVVLVVISLTITYSFYDFINRNRYARKLELEVERRTNQLHNSEKSIRELTQKLITAQEEERERIARELHDNIAQDLSIIKSEVDNFINNKVPNPSPPGKWLSQKLSDLTKYVREMSFFLHPNSIKQTGLLNSLQALCSDHINYSDVKIDYYSNLSEPLKLNEEMQTNIYRFVQEGLANIRKHSKANIGIVILTEKNNTLSIRIEDDGVGFNLNETKNPNSRKKMGLQSMEERIRLMGGTLRIKSVEGEGTKINAQIPLKENT